ncbi:MAG: hypothetical protein KC464_05745, partial [Myxococcales bacterium]|nr:hypothetical protein [Myxococcales bacterium]
IATHARDALALFRAGRAVLAGTGRDAPDGVGDVLYLAARMRIEGRSLLVVTVGLELARSAADRAAALGVDLPALDDLAPRDADVVHALAAEALFSRALIAADRAGAAPSLSAADAAALDAGWRVALDGATLDDPRDQVLERVRRAGAMPAVRRVKTLDLGGMRSTLARAYQAIDAYRDAAARARAAAAP